MASRHSYRDLGAPRRSSSSISALWLLLVLSVGALGGIAAAKYLTRQDSLQPEDPDTPLFI